MEYKFSVSSLQIVHFNDPNIHNAFYSEYFQRMHSGGFFFPCVDYSVVFNYSNTDIHTILCIYCNMSATANILQACNQEDFTSEVFMLLYIYVITFYDFLSLFQSSCVLHSTQSFISSYGLKWHFDPLLSPWWRGIFERMAKSSKISL